LNLFFILGSCGALKGASPDKVEAPVVLFIVGGGVAIASFLWARKGA